MKNDIGFLIVTLLVFLVFPLGALIMVFAKLISASNYRNLWSFAIVTALYISFINASKVIDSDPDLPWYTEQYAMAGQMNYIEYIFWFGLNGKGRELFFPTFNYIVYFIAGDNVDFYRFIHSMVCYTLSFSAIIRFCKYMNIDAWKVIFPITWFACFPWIFTYSQTILRQFLACSFLLCILVEHFFYGKKMWLLFVCMFLSHTSTLIFLPFIYIRFFHKPLTVRTSLVYVAGAASLLFLQSIAGYVAGFLGDGDNALTYAVGRAAQDTTFELPPLGPSKILFLLFAIYVCLSSYYKSKIRAKVLPYNADVHVPLINCIAIFSLFVLGNLRQLELSNRLFTYVTVMSCFPAVYMVERYRPSKQLCRAFFVVMNIMLVAYYLTCMFDYRAPFGVILLPLQYIM